MNTGALFNRGVPVEPEVNLLRAHFVEVHAGQQITHEEIAGVIGTPWGTSRYRSIVVAWRKSLKRQSNVILQSISGIGYKVLTESERIGVGKGDMTKGMQRIAKAGSDLATVDRSKLDKAEQADLDNTLIVASKMTIVMREAKAALLPPAATPTSPRLSVVEQNKKSA